MWIARARSACCSLRASTPKRKARSREASHVRLTLYIRSAYSQGGRRDGRGRVGRGEGCPFGRAELYEGDCLDWLAQREDSSVHAVVTDPPDGLVEYTEKEQTK